MTATGIACQQPDCAGSYAADGFCDECGHKRTIGPPALAPSAPSLVPGPALPIPSQATGHPLSMSLTASGGSPSGMTSVSLGRSRGTRRGRLGANLVEVPPVPLRDPATAVLRDPAVPESRRYCADCGQPVGRSRAGAPGRVSGFCPRDRTPFSFVPRLAAGDLVDDRYEILGALAHGGLGWIYLARDRNISDSGADRWVVLKGLINTGDPDAMASAVTERRFLVEVDHPAIVKIHDFAQHPDPVTGELVGYIVMEYVGGSSLKDLALANRAPDGTWTPLPLPRVLAYAIEVLPALGYLHERGLLFCDFKPDNVIHAEEQLKLIDLGAVRRFGDEQSPLYGTPGYQAPEVPTAGPSVASDLYTVARTLAVLSFDFSGFTTRYADCLPPVDQVPLLAEHESFYRLLRRATDPDPARRFGSAAEMADQLTGVLRDVLSAADGTPRPAVSSNFTPHRGVFGTQAPAAAGQPALASPGQFPNGQRSVLPAHPSVDVAARLAPPSGVAVAAALPVPLPDPADPAASLLMALVDADPAVTLATLVSTGVRSPEVILRLVRARIDAGDPRAARAELDTLHDGDWRAGWYRGLIALVAGDPQQAVIEFDAIVSALPGEPATTLALAAAAELAGDVARAARCYQRVWQVDRGFVSAAFGWARILLTAGQQDAAVTVYSQVPDSSSQHLAAQVAAVRARVSQPAAALSEADLHDAARRLRALPLDAARAAELAAEVLAAALSWLVARSPSGIRPILLGSEHPAGLFPPLAIRQPAEPGARPPGQSEHAGHLLDRPLRERDLRLGLESAYRRLAATQTPTRSRHALVDLANAVRPRTVF